MWVHRVASFVLVLTLVLVPAALAAPGPTAVRAFQVEHIDLADVAAAIQPLLSEDGSLTVQPHRSRITVQDRPEVVAEVARVIAEIDKKPMDYSVEVDLLEGRGEDLAPQQRIEVDSRLKRMFPFAAYRRIGTARLEGVTGQTATADLGEGYRVTFLPSSLGIGEKTPWGIPRPGTRVHLQWLTLERVRESVTGEQRMAEVARASVFLSVKQEVLIGAGASEESSSGLVLKLQAISIGAE
jgi:hypothetical protein